MNDFIYIESENGPVFVPGFCSEGHCTYISTKGVMIVGNVSLEPKQKDGYDVVSITNIIASRELTDWPEENALLVTYSFMTYNVVIVCRSSMSGVRFVDGDNFEFGKNEIISAYILPKTLMSDTFSKITKITDIDVVKRSQKTVAILLCHELTADKMSVAILGINYAFSGCVSENICTKVFFAKCDPDHIVILGRDDGGYYFKASFTLGKFWKRTVDTYKSHDDTKYDFAAFIAGFNKNFEPREHFGFYPVEESDS